MSATSNATHVEIPHFLALTERGNWDACGVVAELAALHACPWSGVKFPTAASGPATVKAWRQQYVDAGHWRGGGCYLSDIYWHLTTHNRHVDAYLPYSDTPNLTALHTFIHTWTLKAHPVIIEVSNAAALPHNEQGIRYHFVCLGGIDSDAGYLVANGDTDAALTTTKLWVPTYWATWATLVRAGICGAIAINRDYTPPAPPPVPPIGLTAVITQAEALVAALKAMTEVH